MFPRSPRTLGPHSGRAEKNSRTWLVRLSNYNIKLAPAKFLKKPLDISLRLCYYNHCSDAEHLTRGYSSAGRALEWHSRGQRFDPAYLHQDREKPWNFGFQGFSRDHAILEIVGPAAQLRERSVRIHSETHPTRFFVSRFPVRFVGLSPENRIFEKSKIRNFFRMKSADLGL